MAGLNANPLLSDIWSATLKLIYLVLLSVVSFLSIAFGIEEGDRRRERNRRNSDSAVYYPPKENASSAVLDLWQLEEAKIEYHRAKIESLQTKILNFKVELEETNRVATEANWAIGHIIEGTNRSKKTISNIYYLYIMQALTLVLSDIPPRVQNRQKKNSCIIKQLFKLTYHIILSSRLLASCFFFAV